MGGFNVKHFLDPLGVGIGKGQSGGLLGALDPAGVFNKKTSSAASSIDSAPIPVPAPGVSAASEAVLLAEHDYAAANMLKKSISKTIIAGDTGGYGKGQPASVAGYKAKLG